jgi:UDPglucose 6-dehydrogenase
MAMPLLDAVIATNRAQPERMLALLGKHFFSLSGVKVTLLGLAFKEDTDDMRESPAIPLAKLLLERGAVVSGYDPVAKETARAAMPAAVTLLDSLTAAVQGADALLLVTRWAEFRQIPELLKAMARQPLLVDGRRIIEPAAVPRYEGIGA